MGSSLFLHVSLALVALGAFTAAWPIKTFNFTQNCDSSVEQYLQVETYDFHEHPKVTMTWRQLTGPCGSAVSDPVEWTATYDYEDGDEPPDEDGRVQLNLFVCSPFGEYELELDIDSSSDAGSTMLQRTSWEIENGTDQYHIWDTVSTAFADIEEYSPTVPGVYTWPFSGAQGFYSSLYAGPLPPIQCSSSVPSGTVYKGCYADSSTGRTFKQDSIDLDTRESSTGMTPQVCSDFCSEFEYFGVEFGYQCYCGTATEFAAATESSNCGMTYKALCSGDATIACGGIDALSVYQRTSNPTPASPTPAPAPVNFLYEGCFEDARRNRVMTNRFNDETMTSQMCYNLCNDGVNNFFGTQFSTECWCGVNPDLTKNGEETSDSECNMDCAGSTTGEKCGGYLRISAYEMIDDPDPDPSHYVGCYADMRNRAMPAAGRYTSASMTNMDCISRCGELGYIFAGTQFAEECWCDDTYDAHGPATNCDMPCTGDSGEICGGFFATSVYIVY